MDHTVNCPGCGRPVTIPQGLDACFCTYCGARVERPQQTEPATALDTAALAKNLRDLVEKDRPLSRQFGRTTYEGLFREHQGHLAPHMESLESALPAGEGREALIGAVADAWLDELEALWRRTARGRTVTPYYLDQHLVAIYTIPALRDLPQSCGEELARALQVRWVARWPKNPIGLGSYQTVSEGFRKRLCFITTAVCRQQGKGDDCYELTAFRRFRDRELLATAEGTALVEEYYRLAPAIVASVELCADSAAVYDRIYRDYLLPCLGRIEAGDAAGCRDKYVEMVRDLERTYLPQ